MDKKKAIILGTILLLGGVGAYFFIRMRRKKKYEVIDFGNTSSSSSETEETPKFNPDGYAKKLMTAMKGWGTDEDAIWQTMGSLTSKQRKEVETRFNKQYGDGSTLKQWFEGDLEGKDLERALAYIN